MSNYKRNNNKMSNSVWGNGYHTGYGDGHKSGMKTAGVIGAAVVGGILVYQNREKVKESIIDIRDRVIDFRDKLASRIEEWLDL